MPPLPGGDQRYGCPKLLAMLVLPAGMAVALSSVLFEGPPGNGLLLGGTALIAAGALAWTALGLRDVMRRERARRQRAARLYAEVMTAMAAALETRGGEER